MSSSRGSFFYLIQLTFIASLGGFLFGYDTGVISGCQSQLETQFSLTKAALGFVTGAAILGCLVGALIAGWLSDHWGRKPVLFLSAILFFYCGFGTMLPEYALGGLSLNADRTQSTIDLLIFSRFVGGIGIGIASMVCPLYLAEISPSRIRGATIAYYQLAITTGMLVCYFANYQIHEISLQYLSDQTQIANPFLNYIFVEESWRAKFGAQIVPAILFLFMIFLTPESPRWLCIKGKVEQARRIFTKIDGSAAVEEIAAVEKMLRSEEKGTIFELFTKKYYIALIIGIFLPMLGQFSGVNAIHYYGPTIYEKAGLGNSFQIQFYIGIVNVLCTFGAIMLVDRIGRRPLIFWGTIGIMISLLWAGMNFLCDVSTGWMIVAPFVFFVGCFAFSIGPLPWIIISEIFPARIRGQAASVGTFSIWLGCFMVAQFFPILQELSTALTFFVFAILVSFIIPLVVFLIPETKGKTLEEIQTHWNRVASK